MESELGALALTAATTLVTALSTSAWEMAKKGVGSLWRRVHPDRVDAVEAELDDARKELLAAREAGEGHIEDGLIGEWQSRLRRLLAANPQLGDDVRRLIDSVKGSPEFVSQVGRVDMRARASRHGRVYQAGRDQHIGER